MSGPHASETPATATDDARELDTARLVLYRFVRSAVSDPRASWWTGLTDAAFLGQADAAARIVRGREEVHAVPLAPGESPPDALDVRPALEALRRPREDHVAEYDRVFGLVLSKECPPYESEYCPQTFSVHRAHLMADVAGFYRAFGLEPSRELPERHDHVALELEFMAWLIAKTWHAPPGERREVCQDAQARFVEGHLAWWVPAFAGALRRKANGPPPGGGPPSLLAAVADVLCAFVPAERAVLGVDPPTRLAAPQPTEQTDASCEGCGLSGRGVPGS